MPRKINDPSNILLKDANLNQFADALIRGNGFGSDSVWVKTYFNGVEYAVIEESISQYQHNCAQYVMKDFFEKECGFKKVKETFYDESGEMAVTYENLETEKDVFKKVYKNVFVMYERKLEKICISINKYSPREITYRLFTTNQSNVLSDWFTKANTSYGSPSSKPTKTANSLVIPSLRTFT